MLTKRRPLAGLLVLFLTPILMLGVGSSPVAAHQTDWIYHGNDGAWVHDDHRTVTVCDFERDGHYVYAELRAWYLGDWVYSREADGGDHGCDTEYFPSGYENDEFRLCEEGKGCTRWYST
jgi:hypothetical protein